MVPVLVGQLAGYCFFSSSEPEKMLGEWIHGFFSVLNDRIHGTGICSYIWLIFMVNVCSLIYHAWMVWLF